MMHSRDPLSKIVSAFAIGLGAGAALGILFAPRSGEDTRAYLRDAASESLDDAAARGKTLLRQARRNLGEAREFMHDVVDTAEGAFRDARNGAS
jgi:gas vesicle protein